MTHNGLETLQFPPRFRVKQRFLGFYSLDGDRAEIYVGELAREERRKVLGYLRDTRRKAIWVDPRVCFVTHPDTTVLAILQKMGFYKCN